MEYYNSILTSISSNVLKYKQKYPTPKLFQSFSHVKYKWIVDEVLSK